MSERASASIQTHELWSETNFYCVVYCLSWKANTYNKVPNRCWQPMHSSIALWVAYTHSEYGNHDRHDMVISWNVLKPSFDCIPWDNNRHTHAYIHTYPSLTHPATTFKGAFLSYSEHQIIGYLYDSNNKLHSENPYTKYITYTVSTG